jgi:two-component system phosphate regulon response regulator PhoB
MRVLLADDEPKVRAALRLTLEQLKVIDTIDEANDAESMVHQLRTSPPDLLLVDWELPGLQRGAWLPDLCQLPSLKVVVLRGRCHVSQLALASGADAFVSKCEPPDRLFATLKSLGAD